MSRMGREDSNAYLVCKRNWIRKDHFIESVTENWRYFRFSPISVGFPPPESIVKYSSRSQRNVYLLKIEANSLRDGSQDIYKDKESNLGPFAGF